MFVFLKGYYCRIIQILFRLQRFGPMDLIPVVDPREIGINGLHFIMSLLYSLNMLEGFHPWLNAFSIGFFKMATFCSNRIITLF
ncbi:hypothetical protein WM43_20645 [Aeromonas veronii]|uniref:Uncharacterized protein n=1 Tax=Aeromonas veronii TaxID=654 RepID=A0AAC9BC11_AERVE|nr:hypothetical protein WM43_20645 [Aeromonas veronii]KIQ83926.1 hypothetical protein RW26_03895 [Aeromonas sp. L_1B5_3]